jgi:hypothetical protein
VAERAVVVQHVRPGHGDGAAPNEGYHLYYVVTADTPLCGISNLLKRLGLSGIELIGEGL